MWPWEHLALGYLLYSGTAREWFRRPPGAAEAVVLGVGTQLPDLVDKPASWVLGVLPSGTSLAHSVFVAVPVSLAAVAVARRWDRPGLGAALAVGYLSHLLGDVAYPVLVGDAPGYSAVLWPLVPAPSGGPSPVLPTVSRLLDRYVEYLASPVGLGYLVLEVALLALAVGAWLRDRAPGAGWLWTAGRRLTGSR